MIIFISRLFQVWSLHTKYFDAFNRLHETNEENEGNRLETDTWEISLDVEIRVETAILESKSSLLRGIQSI